MTEPYYADDTVTLWLGDTLQRYLTGYPGETPDPATVACGDGGWAT